jgi:hypothetical protein
MQNVLLRDYQNRLVRFTAERLAHVLEHPEMLAMKDEIALALQEPDYVIQSRSDENAVVHCKYYHRTAVGNKWLSIVVKYNDDDAFVITAFLTNKLHKGDILWQRPPFQ